MTSCTLAANFGSFDGLKSAHPVRLQPMRRPDPLHAATADPGRLGPRPTGSVRCLAGRFGQRHLDHPLDRLYRQHSGALRAARVASCSGPSTPSAVKRACQRQIVGLPAIAGLPLDRLVPTSSALSSTIRARHTGFCAPFPDRGVQPFPVARTKPDLDALLHPARPAYERAGWNHSSAAIHEMDEQIRGAIGGRAD